MAFRITETVEKSRRVYGTYSTDHGKPFGYFSLKFNDNVNLTCVAYNGAMDGWEHVSVSVAGKNRTPNWNEMCFVKNAFWDEDDTVIQFHPAKNDYVNMHPFCLHLFRPSNGEFPKPNSLVVGFK